MRVALVTENFLPKLDGVTRTLAMLLEHLEREGHRAIVLGPEGAPRRYAGARVFCAPGVPIPFYPELRFLWPRPALERRLARFRPDIVHVVDPMLLGAAGVHWARRLGAPVVSSYHTNLSAYCAYYHLTALVTPMWRYRRYLHNLCAATLCPSPSTASELQRHGFERIGVWPRGVDSRQFTPARRSLDWRRRITGDTTTPILLYTGRLSHEKNLSDLVMAFTALEASGAWLALVGDGPARTDMQQALAGRRVTFTGYLRGDALAQAYASADLFVFPSMTETFGQVVMEAMASGLPVTAYDAEGVRDSVRHGETGLLAPAGDVATLTNHIRTLIDAPDQRLRLGIHARAYAERQDWATQLSRLVTLYASVISGEPMAGEPMAGTAADAMPDILADAMVDALPIAPTPDDLADAIA
ncbi:MAG TPA: glycosyltransferase family 1 protein [Ktedonobacterales bacterium]|jgi:glycosyltransferase involved in cell wall biosynthesis|nr:glycosyltransferase family 1 protein [Ktedonobacterales bacterium]